MACGYLINLIEEVWFQWYLVQAKIIEPICTQSHILMIKPHMRCSHKQDDKDDKYDKMLKMAFKRIERRKAIDSSTQSKTQSTQSKTNQRTISSNILLHLHRLLHKPQ